jgi:hypothetical protein
VLQEQEEKTELEILKTNKFGSELCVRHEENDLNAITVVSDETQMGIKEKINILGAPKFAEQLNGTMSTHVRK